jgi:hypothetical protein
MKLQAQAVLRREDLEEPPRLVGVLMGGSFHPLTSDDAWGPLYLEVGLVALAPLTTVIATDTSSGAAEAMVEARSQWHDLAPGDGTHLRWVPIEQVRDVAEEDIHALIARMGSINDERIGQAPSTPSYHRAARELERLATLVYEAAGAEERMTGGRVRTPSAALLGGSHSEGTAGSTRPGRPLRQD